MIGLHNMYYAHLLLAPLAQKCVENATRWRTAGGFPAA
jgi:hypothetical protein